MSTLADTPRDRDWLIAAVALGCTVIASVLLAWNPRSTEGSAVDTAPVVGKVSFSSADLRRRPLHRLGWADLASGGEVRELDALFVPPGAEARVTFLDGTVLELNERSLVVVDLPHAGRRSVSVRQGSVEGSAGAAGLSAGWRLRAAGLNDFLVLEVDDVIGGTSRSGQNEVSAYPWGAHYLPAPLSMHGPVPKLLCEMGVLTGVDDRGHAVHGY